MIRGIGIDAVEIGRMEQYMQIEGFLSSVFTQAEMENEHGERAAYYAARFACKEALFKALKGPGDFRTIETLNKEDGSPYVVVNGMEETLNIHISITTESGIAFAYCVVEENG